MLKEAKHKRSHMYDCTYMKFPEKANLDTQSRSRDDKSWGWQKGLTVNGHEGSHRLIEMFSPALR